MGKAPEITIQFTNNFGKTFTIDPTCVRFLKLNSVFKKAKNLGELSQNVMSLAMMHNLKEEKKVLLIRFSQFLLDSDKIIASEI